MRRSRIKRRGWIKRGTKPLRRKKRLAPTNKARRAKLHAKNFSGPFGMPHDEWIRRHGCVVIPLGFFGATWRGPVQAAHAKSRGAGGSWRDLVPLCAFHHAQQHRIGTKAFEKKWDIDLAAEAARLVAAHQEEEGATP